MSAEATKAQERPVTVELAKEFGLSAEEYQNALDILGRTPTFTELGIISVMWSEHCSYKSSKVWLKTLPTETPDADEMFIRAVATGDRSLLRSPFDDALATLAVTLAANQSAANSGERIRMKDFLGTP